MDAKTREEIEKIVDDRLECHEAADMIERFASGDSRCLNCLFLHHEPGIISRCHYYPAQFIANSPVSNQSGFPMISSPADEFCSKWVRKP